MIEDERTRSRDERRDVDVREDARGEFYCFLGYLVQGYLYKRVSWEGLAEWQGKWEGKSEINHNPINM